MAWRALSLSLASVAGWAVPPRRSAGRSRRTRAGGVIGRSTPTIAPGVGPSGRRSASWLHPVLRGYVAARLREDWSPEQIAGVLIFGPCRHPRYRDAAGHSSWPLTQRVPSRSMRRSKNGRVYRCHSSRHSPDGARPALRRWLASMASSWAMCGCCGQQGGMSRPMPQPYSWLTEAATSSSHPHTCRTSMKASQSHGRSARCGPRPSPAEPGASRGRLVRAPAT